MLQDASADAPPATSRRGWRGVAFHAVGVVVTVVVAAIGLFAGALASFVTSVCNDSPDVVTAHRHALQLAFLGIGLAIAAAPGLWAVLARSSQRAKLPWAVASGAIVAVTLIAALTVKPSQWCLF